MVYAGQQVFVLAGEESSYNTPVTANKDLGILGSVTLNANNNIIDVRNLGNREAQALVAGNFEADLSFDGTLNSGAVLEMFFGQSTDTQTTGDYRHVFIDDDGTETLPNNVKSFTVQPNFDSATDVTLTFGGCKMNSLDLTVNLGENVQFSSELLAADIDTGTSAGTNVTTNTIPLSFSQCTLQTGVLGSEVTAEQVQSFNISFANNLQRVGGIGSRLAQDMIPANFEATGEYTKVFKNKTEYERFLGGTSAIAAGTPTSGSIIFEASNGLTLGSGRVDLYIRGSGVQYETPSISISTEGVVEATFPFRITTLKDVYFTDGVSTYF